MKRPHFTLRIALAAFAAVLAVSGQDKQTIPLGKAVRSATIGEFIGVATPFQNGFRPEWQYEHNWVRLYDSNGKLVRTNEVNLPDGRPVRIRDVAVSRDGLLAVAADAPPPDVDSGTIVLFDRPGPPRLVIRTTPFLPAGIAIAPDGYIWISGTDPKVEFGIRPPATPEQKRELCVLQKYTAGGLLEGSFLKRSTFGAKVLPWNGSLRASAGGLGLWVRHDDESGEWVDFSLNGDEKGRWILPALEEGLRPMRVVLADSGSVYAEARSTRRLSAAGTYRLNRAASKWDRVEDPQSIPAQGTRLNQPEFLGTDSDRLIFLTRYSPRQIEWFPEPPR